VRPELGAAYEAPSTPVEKDLAAILAETLGLDRVGMRDNFFDLGGQSLLAVKVVSRIRDAFHVDLPLRVLFGAPTVGNLVYEVARLQAERADEEELASLLAELEGMSEDEAAARLGED
jgi:acyl carrier protein